MKNTGIVRRLDPLGRVTLPKELRREKNINEDDAVEFYTNGDLIIMKKYTPGCVFCKSMEYREIDGIRICNSCIEKIRDVKL